MKRTVILLWSALLILNGCAGAKFPPEVNQYTLEYASPAFGDMKPVDASIRLEPFSIVRAYSTTSMVYRTKPFRYGDDAYNRWRVKPSDMLSDLLLRDMRNAGLFRGVFSYNDADNGCYNLGGVIEEIYERESKDCNQAVLGVNVTLVGSSQEAPGQILFQKGYRSVQDMERRDAESLARAMSRAMEAVSREIILDAYNAAKKNKPRSKKECLTSQ
ncbi:MAG: ABC-type transport auxiliary lipoprotein family protein [Syntrophales bacterium]|nr:ABC-type transport auxiliary lipoprotein family protein [Syntrophales bacterium]MDD5532331.1 ABC-type transport auxiliary lipoprotein family protein [Syntrophales bacterium]